MELLEMRGKWGRRYGLELRRKDFVYECATVDGTSLFHFLAYEFMCLW